MQSSPPNRKVATYTREIPRDKRFDTRIWVTVYQSTSDKLAAKIVNISRTGCRFEGMMTLSPSKPVIVRFTDGRKLTCLIKWSNIGAYGCEFTKRLNDHELTEILALGSKLSL